MKITGFDGMEWEVIGFSDDDLTDTTDNTVMHLSGPILTPAQITAALYQTLKQVAVQSTIDDNSIVRTDGGDWLADGYVVGQRVTVDGSAPFTIAGLFDDDLDTLFERLALSGGALVDNATPAVHTVRSVVRTVTAGDVAVLANVPITIQGGPYGGYVTRHDVGGNWADDGFIEGQQVRIQGLDGAWRLRRIEGNGTILRLERGVALPTIAAQSDADGVLAGPARRPHGGPRRRQQPAEDQLRDGHDDDRGVDGHVDPA